MPNEKTLPPRQEELIRALVCAWETSSPAPAHTPFNISARPFEHSNWPSDTQPPSHNDNDVRALVHQGLLEVDRRQAPDWVVFPSARARREYGTGSDHEAEALGDADLRLGTILEAAVRAYEGNPAEPIHFADMQQVSIVQHPAWPLEPDVVRAHDLDLLEQLGLISSQPRGRDRAFVPTPDGRRLVRDPAAFLEERATTLPDEAQGQRLRELAKRLRAGDVVVGTAGGLAAAAIRALVGL